MGNDLIHTFDNFIDNYADLKAYSLTADYTGVENPVDNVVYPYINTDIPESVKWTVFNKLESIFGKQPENPTIFLRQSPLGVHVPHKAHHDLSMGKYSLMLYLNDNPDGGTAMLRHRSTGMCYASELPEFTAIANADMNNMPAWALLERSTMKENRGIIFDAGFYHCALPVGGFGEGTEARTVLTVFFS